MTVVYPHGMVSISSLGSFLSLGSSYKKYFPSLPIYLVARHIQYCSKKKRARKQKYIKPQENKYMREEQRKQIRVVIRSKLVVGFGELIPIESGDNNSAEQDTATVIT